MATVIGAALLLIAAYHVYRVLRAFKAGDRARTAVPSQWIRDRAVDRGVDQHPEPAEVQATRQTRAEIREGELSRQLLAGHLDPATYQERMSQLAHATTETGGSATNPDVTS